MRLSSQGWFKGLQKNIKPLNGNPLIYYSINIAKKCNLLKVFLFQQKMKK